MTIMFCHSCHQLSECRVESPQPASRTVYFEAPYINAYVRVRTCEDCGSKFTTYEIGAETFMTMRKILELVQSTGRIVNETWCSTRDEFFKENAQDSDQVESGPLSKFNEEKLESLLPPNVVLFKSRKSQETTNETES